MEALTKKELREIDEMIATLANAIIATQPCADDRIGPTNPVGAECTAPAPQIAPVVTLH